MGPKDTDKAELPLHALQLEGLAQALVRNHDSEDLVQDAMVTALSQPEPPRKLGPWLRQVLRNRARARSRARERRRARERWAGEVEAVQETLDEEAFRREVLGVVQRALTELEEPYRSALKQRFLEGKEPAEIAKETECGASTIRWRVHEGIRRVRERLDAHFEGRTQWMAGVALIFGLSASATAAAAGGASAGTVASRSAGGGTMTSGVLVKLLAVGAAMAAIVVGTTAALGGAPPTEPSTNDEAGTVVARADTNALELARDSDSIPGLGAANDDDCSGGDCMTEPQFDVCVDRSRLKEPIQVNVMWEPDGPGTHVVSVECLSGCYDPDL